MKKSVVLALVATLSLGAFAVAQDLVPDPAITGMTNEQKVEVRQELMEDNGRILRTAMRASGADAEAAATALLQNYLDMPALFAEGSNVGKSKALPQLWERFADFEAIARTGQEAAAAMLAAAKAGDSAAYSAAARTLGGTCGQCHQRFRG